MIPPEDTYEWMFRAGDDETGLPVLLELREGVEELDDLNASFRLSQITDYHQTHIEEEMLWMLGSWRLPERYSPARLVRYVNPNYNFAGMYSDLAVQCECGAYMIREIDKNGWDGEHNHTEGCCPEWRREAAKELVENRKWWMRKAAELYLQQEEAAPRMGVEHGPFGIICRRYGIDWDQRRKEGRNRAILTWRKLHDEYGYTWKTIAEAFGMSPSCVRSYGNGYGRNIDV